jgi:hypothetical protein
MNLPKLLFLLGIIQLLCVTTITVVAVDIIPADSSSSSSIVNDKQRFRRDLPQSTTTSRSTSFKNSEKETTTIPIEFTTNITSSPPGTNDTDVPSEAPSTTSMPSNNTNTYNQSTTPTLETLWQPRGNDIVLPLSESSREYAPIPSPGTVAIAVSSDGSIVAAGLKGLVRVYQYDPEADTWFQLGQDIVFPVVYLSMASTRGHRIALSSARGIVRVYRYNNGPDAWQVLGPDNILEGDDDDNNQPEEKLLALAMSANGSRLVVRGTTGTTIPTRVYQYTNTAWRQVGQNIPMGDDRGGIDMSADGSTIAIGSPTSDPSFVRVYGYDSDTDTWIRRGDDILGQFNFSTSAGISVAVSDNADKLVMGDLGPGVPGGGIVQVLEFDQSTAQWAQLGNNMGQINEITYEPGIDVACSSNGTIVTYGAYGHARENVPHTAVFEFDANDSNPWVQMGQAVLRGNRQTGIVSAYYISVDLALDGNILVTGSIEERKTPEGVTFEGRVRAFTYGDIASPPSGLGVQNVQPYITLGLSCLSMLLVL